MLLTCARAGDILKAVLLVAVLLLFFARNETHYTRLTTMSAAWFDPEIQNRLARLSSADERERMVALSGLIARPWRPTIEQARLLSGVLRSDRSPRVRKQVSLLIGVLAGQRQYRLTGRNAPELHLLLTALRNSIHYERQADVRVAVVLAAAEFNSDGAQAILDEGKRDIDSTVRDTARSAELRRNQRRLEDGF